MHLGLQLKTEFLNLPFAKGIKEVVPSSESSFTTKADDDSENKRNSDDVSPETFLHLGNN